MITRRAAIIGLLAAVIPASVAARLQPYCHGDHPRHHRLHHKGQMAGHGQARFRDESLTWKGKP